MYSAKAYSVASATSPFASTEIVRRDPTDKDVQIEILFCGICHSDLHQARDEWSGVVPTVYPCVPGHEIVGRVAKVGPGVTKFKPGDLAAVGCMVARLRNRFRSPFSASSSDAAASPALPSAASPRRRRCLISAANKTLPPMSRLSPSRKSTKPTTVSPNRT
jgi:NADPH:quinone reductase-like Zn-dependent oxidoreductase